MWRGLTSSPSSSPGKSGCPDRISTARQAQAHTSTPAPYSTDPANISGALYQRLPTYSVHCLFFFEASMPQDLHVVAGGCVCSDACDGLGRATAEKGDGTGHSGRGDGKGDRQGEGRGEGEGEGEGVYEEQLGLTLTSHRPSRLLPLLPSLLIYLSDHGHMFLLVIDIDDGVMIIMMKSRMKMIFD